MKMTSKINGKKLLLCLFFIFFALFITTAVMSAQSVKIVRAETEYKVTEVSVTLSDDIKMNYVASIPDTYTNPYMVFTFGGEDYQVQGTAESSTTYKFVFDKVTPQYLNSEVTAVIHATSDGEVLSDSHVYSVKTYCESVLALTDAQLNEMGYGTAKISAIRTLVVDLLNYGSASQEFTNTNVENLANADLDQDTLSLGSEFTALDESVLVKGQTGEADSRVSWYSTGLRFDYNVAMYYVFDLSNDVDIANVTLKVTKNGTSYTLSEFKQGAVSATTTKYTAYFFGITLLDFDKVLNAQIYINDVAVGTTFNYSVQSYIYNKQSEVVGETTDLTAMAKLAQKVYVYGLSAKNFKNAPLPDTGTLSKFRMEGENAEFAIAVTDSLADHKKYFTDTDMLGFDLRLSNNLSTRNLNAPNNTATFNFTSDKAVDDVSLDMMVGGYPSLDLNLNAVIKLFVNGKEINLDGITINSSECTQLGHNSYMIFKLVNVKVCLQQGSNSIVIKSLKANGGNLDYIELNTSATITDWNNTRYIPDENAVWTVTKEPTTATTGVLTVTSMLLDTPKSATYTLPALSEENGYNVTVNGTATTYSFKLKNEVKSFVYDPSLKNSLTIADGIDASYADGSKVINLSMGETLPVITFATPDDTRTLLGWYNVDNSMEYWTSTEFSMPNKNLTIAPYYAGLGQTLTAGLRPSNPTASIDNGTAKDTSSMVVGGRVVVDEIGSLITYTGTDGQWFRVMTTAGTKSTDLGVIANKSYTFWFNFKNEGTNTIMFDARQIQGGTNYNNGTQVGTEVFTLAPGESIRTSITITLTSANDNLMTAIVLHNDVTKAQLGMSISKVNNY